ncbi:UDP-N-acetylmuramate dehydrogenase [bacterium]|nr:UDP-N-acetylmuramate dehydrogenase [bacterium]
MIIKEDFEIKNYTTYKIGGKVKRIYMPESQAEFTELLRDLKNYIVLGNCSNVIISSKGYSGNIILTTELKEFEIRGTKVFASCGVKGPLLAQKTSDAGLSGFEFMIGFPGTVGGNICMNAGAHGQSICDNITSCCVFNKKTKEIEYKTKEEMDFSYRHSLLQEGGYVLLYAEFDLKKSPVEEIKSLIERNLEFRKSIQPSLSTPNAGSVFKNPENDSAGRLLDKAGVKEFASDNVKVWNNHANFIINMGEATSEDVLELMARMQNAVKEKFTITLTPEVIFIGDKTKKEEELWNMLYKKTQK